MLRYFLIAPLLFIIAFFRYLSIVPKVDSTWAQYYNESGRITLGGEVLKVDVGQGMWQKLVVGNLYLKTTTSDEVKDGDLDSTLKGKILVKTRHFPEYHYGDLLELRGELQTPPEEENFSYREYLAIAGIYSLLNFPQVEVLEHGGGSFVFRGISKLRVELNNIINLIIGEPQASLLAGIVFGIKRNFEPNFYEALRKTGVLHVVVASGYNIVVVMGFLSHSVSFVGRNTGLLIVAFGIFCYAAVVGFEPPIIRAAIMGAGSLLAITVGRQKQGLLWLQFAALLMLFYNPLLYKSLSFQLSFAATLGMILFSTKIKRRFSFLPEVLADAASTTFSVQIFTLPLVWVNFGEVNLLSLLVNTLVLGVIPLVMNFGALAVVAGFVSLFLARIVVLPAWILLSYFIGVVQMFGG